MGICVSLPIKDHSHVGEARRRLEEVARRLGLDDSARGKLALIVTELAGNIVKYAREGEVVYRSLSAEIDGQQGIQLLALDRGPGMNNVNECLRDGYSTSGSPGTGLGGAMRLSTLFELHSLPQVGTAVLAQVAETTPATSPLEVGAVCLPKPGEAVSGDGWSAHHEANGGALLVADGLGHGLLAAEAAQEAVRVFDAARAEPPARFLALAHDALRKTRGAALAIARVNIAQGRIYYAGIGNIAGTVVGADNSTRSMVSHNGTAGAEVRRIHEFSYPFTPGACIVMHSDGLTRHWQLDKYPGLGSKHPSLIAGVLYRDFRRGTDDVTVVAAKMRRAG